MSCKSGVSKSMSAAREAFYLRGCAAEERCYRPARAPVVTETVKIKLALQRPTGTMMMAFVSCRLSRANKNGIADAQCCALNLREIKT